jgi:DNA repair exonuclease SbcCD nuclease subunit
VLHANVGGREGWEEYAPCSPDDLRQAGMDYWALGHIHGYDEVLDDPLAIYPGSPQGIDPAETGAHGCVLVTVSDGHPTHEFIETAPVRWAQVPVDISGAEGLDQVNDALAAALEAQAVQASEAGTIARVRLEGRSPAHSMLAAEATREDLLSYMREKGMSLSPWVWVDKLVDASGTALDIESMREAEDFLGDLVRHADNLEPSQAIDEVLAELRAKFGALPELDIDAEDALVRARDLCLDLLMPGDDAS